MSKWRRWMSVVFMVVSVVCLVLAGAGWAGNFSYGTLAIGSMSITFTPRLLLMIAIIAFILGYACDPEYVRGVVKKTVAGVNNVASIAVDGALDLADRVTQSVLQSDTFWVLGALVGAYLLLSNHTSQSQDPQTGENPHEEISEMA